MKVYEIRPDKYCNAHTENNLNSAVNAIKEWLSDSEAGTELTVKVHEMTEDIYNNLPEYDGP